MSLPLRIPGFDRIDNLGFFAGWRPDAAVNFLDINVVFGHNGSGKSTLGRGLAAQADPSTTSNSIKIKTSPSGRNDEAWQRVRVFNKDYVHNNLSFDHQGTTSALPLLVLGEPAIEATTRLAELEVKIPEIGAEIALLTDQAGALDTQLRKLHTATASSVVEALQSNSERHAGRRFNARNVRSILEDEEFAPACLMTPALSNAQGMLSSDPLSTPVIPERFNNELRQLATEVQEVASRSILDAAQIDFASPADETWVKQGMELHKNRDSCFFCTGHISETRKAELQAHFNDSYTELMSDLEDLNYRVEGKIVAVKRELSELPDASSYYGELSHEAIPATQSAKRALAAFLIDLESLAGSVSSKITRPFETDLKIADLISDDSALDALYVVTAKHRTISDGHSARRIRAIQAIEKHLISAAAAQHWDFTKQRADLLRILGSTGEPGLQAKLESLKAEKATLENPIGSPLPLASELTAGLARLLGRSELTFEFERGKYQISRDSQPATHLSEGEQTAISLLYFLHSLRSGSDANSDVIIVIDDPVSSLDESNLAGISGLIWRDLIVGSNHQVFVFTHSYSLFRSLGLQIRSAGNDLALSSNRDIKRTAELFELRATMNRRGKETVTRAPKMSVWPKSDNAARMLSDYHFSFWRVGSSLLELRKKDDSTADYEAAMLLPNVCRKLLEGFLAFRFPHKLGNFTASMNAAIETINVPTEVGLRMTRVLHAFSHSESADTSTHTPPQEAFGVLQDCLWFMSVIDSSHFDSMCTAVNLPKLSEIVSERGMQLSK